MRHVNKMKLFAITLLAVFYLAVGYPVDDDLQGEGVARQYRVAVENYLQTTVNSRVGGNDAKNVKFYLYTVQQPEKVELKLESLAQYLQNSSYDVGRPTKIFIHDRLFSEYHYKELITAYLTHYHTPVNVITVDYSYSTGVEHKEFIKIYRGIGASVATFVEGLRDYGVSGDNIHVIAHGIGAHIAAVAAKGVTPFKFGRITGLDPVGLEFDEDTSLPQLQKNDAEFVDVIFTNTAGVGSNKTGRAHVNFYPNGGATQPKSDMLVSHLKSYFYYVESISRGKVFQAYVAKSYAEWTNGKYDHGEVNYMGEYVTKSKAGNFYLGVNPLPPYGLNTDSTFKVGGTGTKFYETYMSLILGSELSPWAFVPKENPYFGKAVTNQKTLYVGLGERPHNYNTGNKGYEPETLHYSVEKPRQLL